LAFIAVDMTPVLPGGKNGGAKILAIELLKSFHEMAIRDRFLILTASWNHEDLAVLDGPNMRRSCILTGQEPKPKAPYARYSHRLHRAVRRIRSRLRRIHRSKSPMGRSLAAQGVDLLFCPFTAPIYAEKNIPTVSVVLDLQHIALPQFFSLHEIGLRNDFMMELTRKADRIICISEHTRKTVLKHLGVPPEKTHSVPICIQTRLSRLEPEKYTQNLVNFGIAKRPYMFYPANFWPHKNHSMLLTAYGMFLARNPESPLDLVFTGALDGEEGTFRKAVSQMGLAKRVHFLGFVLEEKLAAVWSGCEFLIFPSLYEGFGIPVLEAMSIGKPVLCSDQTSLPEVAGDAALYFDPRNPKAIVDCIEQITTNPFLKSTLVEKGRNRASLFKPEDMTQQYLEIFKQSIKSPGSVSDGITGIFKDGWMGEKSVVAYASGSPERVLEMKLEAPSWLPARRVKVEVSDSHKILQRVDIRSGREMVIRQVLPHRQGYITLSMAPTFNPSDYGLGDDLRNLSVFCRECKLVSPHEETILLQMKRSRV